jgi:hypothetical protein
MHKIAPDEIQFFLTVKYIAFQKEINQILTAEKLQMRLSPYIK